MKPKPPKHQNRWAVLKLAELRKTLVLLNSVIRQEQPSLWLENKSIL
jgi:hypothetical protein